MNMLVKMSQLQKMNQQSSTDKGGSGGAASGQQAGQAAAGAQKDPKAQAAGGDSAAQETSKEDLGYEEAEQVSVGEYDGDEGLKEKAKKPHEKINLGYELENTEGLSDEDLLEVKTIASKNKLSKEAAVAFVDIKKNQSQKVQDVLAKQKLARETQTKAYKQAEVDKLKAEIGGENGKDWKPNLKKINDFLAQHLPELKKDIDVKGAFLPASVMKDLFNLQAKLQTEDKLVLGGQKSGDQNDAPVWERRYS